MTIAFDSTAVKTIRPASQFGQGVLPTYPSFKAPWTASDAAWYAEEAARAEDREFDRRYNEFLAGDRMESGVFA